MNVSTIFKTIAIIVFAIPLFCLFLIAQLMGKAIIIRNTKTRKIIGRVKWFRFTRKAQ